MNVWVIVASVAMAVIAIALAVLLVRLMTYRRPATGDDAPPEFSLSRYQPMTQVMSEEDLDFFERQPGVTRAQKQQFRRNRRRIFRLYLRELTADFQLLHGQAREIVAHAPGGAGELVGSLMRLQVDFWRFLAWIEWGLALDWMGFGSVDSRRLLDTIQTLHQSVSRSTSSPGPIMV